MRNIKKYIVLAILLLVILLVPIKAEASSVSASISGYSSAKPGDTLTYTISAISSVGIVSFNGNIQVSGATISGFSASTGTGAINGNKIGLMFDTAKSGNIVLGTLTVKVPNDASDGSTVELSLTGTAGDENFTNISVGSASKTVTIIIPPADEDKEIVSNSNNNNANNNSGNSTSNKNSSLKSESNKSVKTNKKQATNKTELSNVNTLKSLTIGGITFDFNKDILEYNFEVEHDVEEILINYETDSEKANVKIEGDSTLNIGINEKKIIVSAENGETKTYTLIINRKDVENIEQQVEEIIQEENEKISTKTLLLIVIIVIVTVLVYVFIMKKKTSNKK